MKLQYYFSIISFFMLIVGAKAQTQFVPMVELFTNASCIPCAEQQQHYDDILSQFDGKIVSMQYHYTPDNEADTLASQETNIPLRRKNFYLQKIKELPAMVIDGETWPGRSGAPKDLTSAMISESLAKTSLITMNVTHTINENRDSAFVEINLANESPDRFEGKDVYIYVALIEKHIKFNQPIGDNGQVQFRNVVRKMLPSYNGKSLGRNILSGRTLDFNFETDIPDYLYDINQLAIVAWLQHTKDKVIYQVDESAPIDFTGTNDQSDLSFINVNPNPASEFIIIEADFPNAQNANISMFDINGHQVAQLKDGVIHDETIKYSTSKLKTGTYFIRCQTNSNTTVKKVLVVK